MTESGNPFSKGFDAYYSGENPDSSPYEEGSNDDKSWCNGYLQAHRRKTGAPAEQTGWDQGAWDSFVESSQTAN